MDVVAEIQQLRATIPQVSDDLRRVLELCHIQVRRELLGSGGVNLQLLESLLVQRHLLGLLLLPGARLILVLLRSLVREEGNHLARSIGVNIGFDLQRSRFGFLVQRAFCARPQHPVQHHVGVALVLRVVVPPLLRC